MVYHDSALIPTARSARAVRQARRPALANREHLRLKRMVAAAVCRVGPGMSHPDDHAHTVSKTPLKHNLVLWYMKSRPRWYAPASYYFLPCGYAATRCDKNDSKCGHFSPHLTAGCWAYGRPSSLLQASQKTAACPARPPNLSQPKHFIAGFVSSPSSKARPFLATDFAHQTITNNKLVTNTTQLMAHCQLIKNCVGVYLRARVF